MAQKVQKTQRFFYQHKVPNIDELVMVCIIDINDISILCSLLEYNNIEAHISLCELGKRRTQTVFRCKQKHVLRVINIDNDYINVSKKHINEEDRERGMKKYKNGKFVNRIARHIAEVKYQDIEDIYKLMIWPLDDPIETFKLLLDDIDIYENLIMPTDYKELLSKIVKHELEVQPIKVGLQVDVTSFIGGINDIKHALRMGLANSSVLYDIKIQLVSSPTFLIFTMTTNEDGAIEAIKDVANTIKDEITKLGGNFVCDKAPGIIGA